MIVRVTVLTVPAAAAEIAAERMMQAGAFAVEECDIGASEVELRGSLADALPVAIDRLGELPADWSVRIDEVDATPADTWREHAVPIEVTDELVIRPGWLAPLDRPGVTEVAIEPGAAFGLGDHPTTRLSACAVWSAVSAGDALLDVGCGTGVLAIVGALAGAGRAVGIDIAEAAVPATLDNAARNGVSERVEVSTTPLEGVEGTYDVVVANILAPALIALADDLRRVVAPAGRLFVSGILADRHDHVLDALRPMIPLRTTTLDGWAAVELRHP